MAAESYLEAGHRGFFANGGTALELYPALTARSAPPQEATCAPFARGISEVEPIWQVLRERAHALGYAIPRRSITPDLELHLLADGAVVPAQAVADGCLGFTVPPARIRSAWSRAASSPPITGPMSTTGAALAWP